MTANHERTLSGIGDWNRVKRMLFVVFCRSKNRQAVNVLSMENGLPPGSACCVFR